MSVVIVRSDARQLPLADGSVDLVVTSPPYFGLREYRDEGGTIVEGQIGLEPDPLDYLDALLEVTAECFRVLRPGGSMFVNLGDKRADRAGGRDNTPAALGDVNADGRRQRPRRANTTRLAPRGSRLMLPERFALLCLDKLGLSVRQRIVWDKPSALPESVTDRCRDSDELLLHLVRGGERYYSAVDRIRQPHAPSSVSRSAPWRAPSGMLHGDHPLGTGHRVPATSTTHPAGALPGTVWRIPTVPLDVPKWLTEELGLDHHAAFPPELARRCIVGWSPERRCLECGAGLRPVVDKPAYGSYNDHYGDRLAGRGHDAGHRNRVWRARVAAGMVARIVGETCDCQAGPGDTEQAVVLDPFGGTGTTALVADTHGRLGISADLSHGYGRIAQWRTADDRERARAMGMPMPPKQSPGQDTLWP